MQLFPVSKITGRRYKFRQVLGSAISLCLSIHKNRTVYCDAFQRFNPQNINKSYVTQPLSSICIYTLYVIHTFFIGSCAQMSVEGFSFECCVIQPLCTICAYSTDGIWSYVGCLQGMPTLIKDIFKVCQLVKINRCFYSKRLCLFSNLLNNTR